MSNTRWPRIGALAAAAVVGSAVVACSGGAEPAAPDTQDTQAPAPVPVEDPLVATYDGGLYILDGGTLEVRQDIPLDGFLRVNPAGDDSHVLVTTSDGFRVLDAADGRLTEDTFAAADPGHVVAHGERTVLFADGSGEITAFDPHALADGMPETEQFTAAEPHHGVAVVLADGTLVHSVGDPDNRSGAVALDGDREIARSAECPGIHGETVVADEVVVFGCDNGALEYANGEFTKIVSPTPFGRIGTAKGHDDSPVALADMTLDPDAELERPEQVALVDTAADRMQIVKLPAGVSYSFRSLARGPQAEALVLGTDGNLYVVDPVIGDVVTTVPVTQEWTEPDDWQDPRPTVFTREDQVFVTDPAARQIHRVDLEQGTVTASVTLDREPNELSGTVGHHH